MVTAKDIATTVLLCGSVSFLYTMEDNLKTTHKKSVDAVFPFKEDVNDCYSLLNAYFGFRNPDNFTRALWPSYADRLRNSLIPLDALTKRLSQQDTYKNVKTLQTLYEQNPHTIISKKSSVTLKDVWSYLPQDILDSIPAEKKLNNQEKMALNILIGRALWNKEANNKSDNEERKKNVAEAINLWNVVSGKKYPWLYKSDFTIRTYLWWNGYMPIPRQDIESCYFTY